MKVLPGALRGRVAGSMGSECRRERMVLRHHGLHEFWFGSIFFRSQDVGDGPGQLVLPVNTLSNHVK